MTFSIDKAFLAFSPADPVPVARASSIQGQTRISPIATLKNVLPQEILPGLEAYTPGHLLARLNCHAPDGIGLLAAKYIADKYFDHDLSAEEAFLVRPHASGQMQFFGSKDIGCKSPVEPVFARGRKSQIKDFPKMEEVIRCLEAGRTIPHPVLDFCYALASISGYSLALPYFEPSGPRAFMKLCPEALSRISHILDRHDEIFPDQESLKIIVDQNLSGIHFTPQDDQKYIPVPALTQTEDTPPSPENPFMFKQPGSVSYIELYEFMSNHGISAPWEMEIFSRYLLCSYLAGEPVSADHEVLTYNKALGGYDLGPMRISFFGFGTSLKQSNSIFDEILSQCGQFGLSSRDGEVCVKSISGYSVEPIV